MTEIFEDKILLYMCGHSFTKKLADMSNPAGVFQGVSIMNSVRHISVLHFVQQSNNYIDIKFRMSSLLYSACIVYTSKWVSQRRFLTVYNMVLQPTSPVLRDDNSDKDLVSKQQKLHEQATVAYIQVRIDYHLLE